MPNQNQSDPNYSSQQSGNPTVQQPAAAPPVIFPQSDLPPFPPVFQDLPENDKTTGQLVDQPTMPPAVNGDNTLDTQPDISSINPKPKKRFGKGKIIATILGIVVLVGGVGAGVLMTQQQQIFQPQACGPSESLSCVSLTKDAATPKLNDTINLTCEANSYSGNPVAYFRYQTPGTSSFVEDPNAYTISSSTHKATKSTQVSAAGSWTWQCRVCKDNTKAKCTNWGESGGSSD